MKPDFLNQTKLKLKKRGNNVTIYPTAKIINPENIEIGDETVIDDFVFMYDMGGGIKIGNFCHITVHSYIQSGGRLEIGDFSAISPGGIVLAASDDYKGDGFIGLGVFGKKYRNTQCKDVIMGKHVHVGAGSIILPGVTLGEGCSIGSGSVVTESMPEWTICYGSPCKPIKDKSREKQLQMEKEFLEEYYSREKEKITNFYAKFN